MDYLRAFYDIMGECGMLRPPWEVWRAYASDNAELWPIMGRSQDGAPLMVGGVLFKGHTIHIAVRPDWQGRWIRPSMLKAWRQHYTHECDLYATPMADNAAACELAERLGFQRRGTSGQSVIYVKEKVPCPQHS